MQWLKEDSNKISEKNTRYEEEIKRLNQVYKAMKRAEETLPASCIHTCIPHYKQLELNGTFVHTLYLTAAAKKQGCTLLENTTFSVCLKELSAVSRKLAQTETALEMQTKVKYNKHKHFNAEFCYTFFLLHINDCKSVVRYRVLFIH